MSNTIVWFNHWFSTAYHIINLMRESSEIYVIGTSKNPDSVVGLACDEWHSELDNITDEEYIDFALDFCKAHNVDIFVPRRCMNLISINAKRFERIGVKLLLDTNGEMLSVLKNKIKTYEWFEGFAPECVPIYFEVKSVDDFIAAYEKITAAYSRCCFKFADDEGAVSFRVIDNSMVGAGGLYRAPGMKISKETAVEILSDYSFENSLIVMPYLEGVEVSCDCLELNNDYIIVPRYKSNGRIYTVRYDDEIMRLCRKFLQRSELKMPCNVQFKYHQNVPYLLEVNTRMSGGVQLSCLAADVNIPRIALGKLLNKNQTFSLDYSREIKISYVENPVLISEKSTISVKD